MKLLILIAIPLCLAAPALSNSYANLAAEDQQPIAPYQDCITRTRVVTATSYEINVVSTVYRYQTHATPTPEKQTLRFGVEGTGCDVMACKICRMMNSCSDEEENCTGCDLAYYCNQCPPPRRESEVIPEGFRISKTCSAPDGSSVTCEEIEKRIENQHKAYRTDL